jgi:hypothetical protein
MQSSRQVACGHRLPLLSFDQATARERDQKNNAMVDNVVAAPMDRERQIDCDIDR